MATGAIGEERPTLFLRKATGLVRGWSVRDSLIYACLATNFVTLGIYEFTFAGPAFPKGQLITAVIIGGIWVSFLVIAYSGLVVTIPRPAATALADPDPGQRHRLRDGRDRLVVHSLAVGAHLRKHLGSAAVPAAVGDARVDLAWRWLRVVRHRTPGSSS